MSEWTITVSPPAGVRDTVAAFEQAWLEGDGADIDRFLPLPDDASYTIILHDLIRLDLRLSWAADRPRRLADFLDSHPSAFEDRAWVSAMALEEYRARTAAGEPVQAASYARQFAVDVSGWRSRRTFLRPSSDPDDPRQTAVMAIRSGSDRTGNWIPPAHSLPRAGQTFFDFELIRELGRGVFGRVFLARQKALAGRPVALKVTTEIDTEPQTLARLQHTNIVPIYSVAQHGSLQAICMPYFGSVTLAQVIRTISAEARLLSGTGRRFLSTLFEMRATICDDVHQATGTPIPEVPPPPAEEPPSLKALADMTPVEVALWITARLADGLAHAHERGVLHCDLKPANILLADDGQPMLLDFNVAAERSARKTSRLGGTLPYMAPEHLDVIAGRGGSLTPQCDLYSLGVVLYELLTGSPPFEEPSGEPAQMLAIYRDLHSRVPVAPSTRNPAVSPATDAIVLKLLEPNPAVRYAEATQVREDLERQLTNRPLAFARDRAPLERVRKWQRRHPRLSVGLMVGVAALLFLIVPATVVAVRQNQLAERRHEIARAEAILEKTQSVRELRLAQTLLSSRIHDRTLLREGLDRARRVVAEYGVDSTPDWASQSRVALLSGRQQAELRAELGETLLMMARAEQTLAADGDEAAARAALRWNELAERCYAVDARPRLLVRQRARLLEIVPGAASPLDDPGPTAADAYHEAVELAAADRPADALLKLSTYTDDNPDHFLAWYARGACHERVGQYADAAAAFTVCATLWPDFAPVYFSRGYSRLRQGRPADAEADFTRALERRPGWTDALLNRAIARDARKDHSGAEADLTQVLDSADAPTRAYFIRARVRKALGDLAGSEADVTRGRELVPTDEVSWLTRGFWNLAVDPKAALADYEQALQTNPRSRDALLNKAVVLAEQLRRTADAVSTMDRLLELYPAYTEARAGRGIYLARLGDTRRATADAARVLAEEPTTHRLYQMAGVYALLSKGESAGTHRQEALKLLAQAFRAGFNQFDKLNRDPDLEPLRDDPTFQSMVEHARKLRAQ